MEDDPDKINDHVRQTLLKRGKAYADDNAESKDRNKSRAEGREAIKAIGMNPNAFATAMKHIKDMSPRERKEWLSDYQVTMKVHGPSQQELFPEESLKHEKREADRKAKEAEAKAEAKRLAESDKPGSRSDPKSGGAGKVADAPKKGRGKKGDTSPKAAEVAAGIGTEPGSMQQPGDADKFLAEKIEAAKNGQLEHQQGTLEEREAAEGEEALKAGLPQSQSAQAAAVRDKLGL